jgi:redox-sensing transcriptional repressor
MIYYRRLKTGLQNGEKFISSTDLGLEADASPEQVRKDLSFLPSQGRSRVGYPTQALAGIIEDYLGLVHDKEAILVGAGNLGRALALYPGFAQYGLKITVLFDSDPQKIGSQVGNLQVLPVSKLTNLVQRMMIQIGILTTPTDVAQEVTDAMVAGGIKAIWNFTNARLVVPNDVFVRNTDLSPELVMISHYVKGLALHALEGQNPETAPDDPLASDLLDEG